MHIFKTFNLAWQKCCEEESYKYIKEVVLLKMLGKYTNKYLLSFILPSLQLLQVYTDIRNKRV